MLEDAIVHVVDDEEAMRSSLADLLRSVGYRVRLYSRAEDFLVADISGIPGCVIADVRPEGKLAEWPMGKTSKNGQKAARARKGA